MDEQLGRETRTCSPSPAPPVPVGASRRQSGQQEPLLPFQDGSGEQRGTQLAGGTVSSGDTAREAPVCWEWGGRAAPNRSVGLSLGRALSQFGCDPHRRERTTTASIQGLKKRKQPLERGVVRFGMTSQAQRPPVNQLQRTETHPSAGMETWCRPAAALAQTPAMPAGPRLVPRLPWLCWQHTNTRTQQGDVTAHQHIGCPLCHDHGPPSHGHHRNLLYCNLLICLKTTKRYQSSTYSS